MSILAISQALASGEDYKKLLLIEGQPLDAKTQKKVDTDPAKTRTERQKQRTGVFHRTISLGDLEQMAKFFDNQVTGQETVLGRKTWRVESRPKPGYRPADKQEEQAMAARHVAWFNQEDGVLIRRHDEFIRAVNGFQPGTMVDWEFAKVGEECLPDNLIFRTDLKFIPGNPRRDSPA